MNKVKRGVLRLHLGGRWRTYDVGVLFWCLEDLYNICNVIHTIGYKSELMEILTSKYQSTMRNVGFSDLQSLQYHVRPTDRLKVIQMHLASPGIVDVIGVGHVIGHVKDLLQYIIDLAVNKSKRELENRSMAIKNEELMLRNQALLLENIKRFVEIKDMSNYSDRDIKLLVNMILIRQRPLLGLAGISKLISVSINNDKVLDENK